MTTITTRQPVELSPAEADLACTLLRSLSATAWAQARRTKHAAVRDYAETQGANARDLEAAIVARMYRTEVTP